MYSNNKENCQIRSEGQKISQQFVAQNFFTESTQAETPGSKPQPLNQLDPNCHLSHSRRPTDVNSEIVTQFNPESHLSANLQMHKSSSLMQVDQNSATDNFQKAVNQVKIQEGGFAQQLAFTNQTKDENVLNAEQPNNFYEMMFGPIDKNKNWKQELASVLLDDQDDDQMPSVSPFSL